MISSIFYSLLNLFFSSDHEKISKKKNKLLFQNIIRTILEYIFDSMKNKEKHRKYYKN